MASRVEQALVEVLEQLEAGREVTPVWLRQSYPDCHEELAELLEAQGRLARPPLEAIGPYRLLERLGRGGSGTVYLAEAREKTAGLDPGARVALKVVHPHLLEHAAALQRFALEAEIGLDIRHENLVRTLDFGIDESTQPPRCYLVLEYSAGQTLRALLSEVGALPEGLTRNVGCMLARALRSIHAEGIVHRDLKPENVLLAPGEVVKLMDLGVAGLLSEEIRRRPGERGLSGTLRYMAPEQLRGQMVDGRTDLYALGLILYELVTGEPALGAGSAPQPLRSRRPDVSPFLAAVVGRLLEEDRSLRFRSAEELVPILEHGEESAWWRDAAAKRERRGAPAAPPQGSTPATAMHGRRDALETLERRWAKARDGEGQVVLVRGDPGIGKTRLVEEFVGTLHDTRVVLWCRHAPESTDPLEPVARAIGELFDGEDLEKQLREVLAEYPKLIEPLAALLGGTRPPESGVQLTKEALATLCTHILRSHATARPLVFVVEDLHHAARSGLDLFLAVARSARKASILLIGTTRPGIAPGWLEEIQRLAHATDLELPPLTEEHVRQILLEALPSSVLADELAPSFTHRSGGNPLFLLGLIRARKDTPDSAAASGQPVAETIRKVVRDWLAKVEPSERDILNVASCVGVDFGLSVLHEVLGWGKVEVYRHLVRLDQHHHLVRRKGERWSFAHEFVYEEVKGDLPMPLHRAYHRELARTYEERAQKRGETLESLPAEVIVPLARHLLESGDPREAMPFLLPVLDTFRLSERSEDVVRLADLALEAEGSLTQSDRAEILIKKAMALEVHGSGEARREAAEAARAAADESGNDRQRASAWRVLACVLRDQGDCERFEKAIARVLASARSLRDPGLEAKALGIRGAYLLQLLRLNGAIQSLDAARRLAAQIGAKDIESNIALELGICFRRLGREQDASRAWKQAISCAQAGNTPHVVIAARHNLHLQAEQHMEPEAAVAHWRELVGEWRALGNRGSECMTLVALASCLEKSGNRGEALECRRRAEELAIEAGHRRHEAVAVAGLVNHYLAGGYLSEALNHAERHRLLCEAIRHSYGVFTGGMLRGRLCWMCGQWRRAESLMADAWKFATELENLSEKAKALHELGWAAEHKGTTDAAETFYRRALEIQPKEEAAPHRRALAHLGRVLLDTDRGGEARSVFRRAAEAATAWNEPNLEIVARVGLLALGDEDEIQVRERLRTIRSRLHVWRCLEAFHGLWKATGNADDLAEAWQLVCHLRDHAPEGCRDSMIRDVPIYREVAEAVGQRRA